MVCHNERMIRGIVGWVRWFVRWSLATCMIACHHAQDGKVEKQEQKQIYVQLR